VLAPVLFRQLGLAVSHELWKKKKSDDWSKLHPSKCASSGPRRRRPPSSAEPQPLSTLLPRSLISPPGQRQRPPAAAAGASLANDRVERRRALDLAGRRSRLFIQIANQNPTWTHEQMKQELFRLIE
jgi:hypothetical protein